MVYCGIFLGFLGFDLVIEEINWIEEIIILLRMIGEMFINIL